MISVAHALGSYPVLVEPGLLARLGALVEEHLGGQVAMVTDSNVAPLVAGWTGSVEPAWALRLVVPAGEASKTRDRWAALSDALLERGLGRDAGLVALGGGVVGDLAGFVAATYLRGIRYVQVPTTLLAMVDASVGGKTAVDTPYGKNLIGAFHPPVAVLADPLALRTLPERELRGGLAETVKHGLIADAEYLGWIEAEADAILARDPATLTRLVRRSVEIKAAVVAEDEREAGRRAILNAGHTVAHALEHVSRYTLPHGEAVALGLVAETRLAERIGVAPAGLAARVERTLARLGLPIRLTEALAEDAVVEAMTRDKKNRPGKAAPTAEPTAQSRQPTADSRQPIHFTLPHAIGRMHQGDGSWTVAVPEVAIREAVATLR